MKLEKYSFGIGDRFGQQGEAQLQALLMAKKSGIEMVPVWNKSNREHQIIHSTPSETFEEAKNAVNALDWEGSWYVDADHINLKTVEPFLQHANFFTLDVADYIGISPAIDEKVAFMDFASPYIGKLSIDGIDDLPEVSTALLEEITDNYLGAISEAASIYRFVAERKGTEDFVAEVSMDEVETPQTPLEMFFILMMIKHYKIPAQTIAPKFTGRFNKGVDYEGDIDTFRKEFEEDLLVIDQAIREFALPENLKLSVHSGSDKFSIYPIMGELIRKHNKGIHIKTAGTTWLEEVIGLAMAGGDALALVKKIYGIAYDRQDELCSPYATVIDIDPASLPAPSEVNTWDEDKFASTLRHIPDHPNYHHSFRQLIHVGYKVAAEMGNTYLDMLNTHSSLVGEQVCTNIYERHIKRVF